MSSAVERLSLEKEKFQQHLERINRGSGQEVTDNANGTDTETESLHTEDFLSSDGEFSSNVDNPQMTSELSGSFADFMGRDARQSRERMRIEEAVERMRLDIIQRRSAASNPTMKPQTGAADMAPSSSVVPPSTKNEPASEKSEVTHVYVDERVVHSTNTEGEDIPLHMTEQASNSIVHPTASEGGRIRIPSSMLRRIPPPNVVLPSANGEQGLVSHTPSPLDIQSYTPGWHPLKSNINVSTGSGAGHLSHTEPLQCPPQLAELVSKVIELVEDFDDSNPQKAAAKLKQGVRRLAEACSEYGASQQYHKYGKKPTAFQRIRTDNIVQGVKGYLVSILKEVAPKRVHVMQHLFDREFEGQNFQLDVEHNTTTSSEDTMTSANSTSVVNGSLFSNSDASVGSHSDPPSSEIRIVPSQLSLRHGAGSKIPADMQTSPPPRARAGSGRLNAIQLESKIKQDVSKNSNLGDMVPSVSNGSLQLPQPLKVDRSQDPIPATTYSNPVKNDSKKVPESEQQYTNVEQIQGQSGRLDIQAAKELGQATKQALQPIASHADQTMKQVAALQNEVARLKDIMGQLEGAVPLSSSLSQIVDSSQLSEIPGSLHTPKKHEQRENTPIKARRTDHVQTPATRIPKPKSKRESLQHDAKAKRDDNEGNKAPALRTFAKGGKPKRQQNSSSPHGIDGRQRHDLRLGEPKDTGVESGWSDAAKSMDHLMQSLHDEVTGAHDEFDAASKAMIRFETVRSEFQEAGQRVVNSASDSAKADALRSQKAILDVLHDILDNAGRSCSKVHSHGQSCQDIAKQVSETLPRHGQPPWKAAVVQETDSVLTWVRHSTSATFNLQRKLAELRAEMQQSLEGIERQLLDMSLAKANESSFSRDVHEAGKVLAEFFESTLSSEPEASSTVPQSPVKGVPQASSFSEASQPLDLKDSFTDIESSVWNKNGSVAVDKDFDADAKNMTNTPFAAPGMIKTVEDSMQNVGQPTSASVPKPKPASAAGATTKFASSAAALSTLIAEPTPAADATTLAHLAAQSVAGHFDLNEVETFADNVWSALKESDDWISEMENSVKNQKAKPSRLESFKFDPSFQMEPESHSSDAPAASESAPSALHEDEGVSRASLPQSYRFKATTSVLKPAVIGAPITHPHVNIKGFSGPPINVPIYNLCHQGGESTSGQQRTTNHIGDVSQGTSAEHGAQNDLHGDADQDLQKPANIISSADSTTFKQPAKLGADGNMTQLLPAWANTSSSVYSAQLNAVSHANVSTTEPSSGRDTNYGNNTDVRQEFLAVQAEYIDAESQSAAAKQDVPSDPRNFRALPESVSIPSEEDLEVHPASTLAEVGNYSKSNSSNSPQQQSSFVNNVPNERLEKQPLTDLPSAQQRVGPAQQQHNLQPSHLQQRSERQNEKIPFLGPPCQQPDGQAQSTQTAPVRLSSQSQDHLLKENTLALSQEQPQLSVQHLQSGQLQQNPSLQPVHMQTSAHVQASSQSLLHSQEPSQMLTSSQSQDPARDAHVAQSYDRPETKNGQQHAVDPELSPSVTKSESLEMQPMQVVQTSYQPPLQHVQSLQSDQLEEQEETQSISHVQAQSQNVELPMSRAQSAEASFQGQMHARGQRVGASVSLQVHAGQGSQMSTFEMEESKFHTNSSSQSAARFPSTVSQPITEFGSQQEAPGQPSISRHVVHQDPVNMQQQPSGHLQGSVSNQQQGHVSNNMVTQGESTFMSEQINKQIQHNKANWPGQSHLTSAKQNLLQHQYGEKFTATGDNRSKAPASAMPSETTDTRTGNVNPQTGAISVEQLALKPKSESIPRIHIHDTDDIEHNCVAYLFHRLLAEMQLSEEAVSQNPLGQLLGSEGIHILQQLGATHSEQEVVDLLSDALTDEIMRNASGLGIMRGRPSSQDLEQVQRWLSAEDAENSSVPNVQDPTDNLVTELILRSLAGLQPSPPDMPASQEPSEGSRSARRLESASDAQHGFSMDGVSAMVERVCHAMELASRSHQDSQDTLLKEHTQTMEAIMTSMCERVAEGQSLSTKAFSNTQQILVDGMSNIAVQIQQSTASLTEKLQQPEPPRSAPVPEPVPKAPAVVLKDTDCQTDVGDPSREPSPSPPTPMQTATVGVSATISPVKPAAEVRTVGFQTVDLAEVVPSHIPTSTQAIQANLSPEKPALETRPTASASDRDAAQLREGSRYPIEHSNMQVSEGGLDQDAANRTLPFTLLNKDHTHPPIPAPTGTWMDLAVGSSTQHYSTTRSLGKHATGGYSTSSVADLSQTPRSEGMSDARDLSDDEQVFIGRSRSPARGVGALGTHGVHFVEPDEVTDLRMEF